MEKSNYANEELKLRKKLRKMRIIATSLLIVMTVIFVIFKKYDDRGLLFSSIAAFAEASMVGALADWFAVVALFKHPMGLKIIPHTAIIQNNKQRIAESLSNFVVSNFFTPEIIKSKLEKISMSQRLSEYIEANKEKISKGIALKLPIVLNSIVDDVKIKEYLKSKVTDKTGEIELYPVLSNFLMPAVDSGYHKPIIKALLNSAYNFVGQNKEKMLTLLGGINKTLAMPFIGDLIYKKILDFLLEQLEEIDSNDEAEINKLILSALPNLLEDMQNDRELIEKGEQLKTEIVSSEVFSGLLDKLTDIAVEYKDSFLKNQAELAVKVKHVLEAVVKGVSENNELKSNIDAAIIDIVEGIVSQYGSKVGSLIYDTMDGWETKDMVDKLEVQVGADLQYIRINGTVIGGLAGLVIHLVSQLF